MSQKDLVLDECGAVFVFELNKYPEQFSVISKRIAARFLDGDQNEVDADLMELLLQLEADGFVLMANSIDELHNMEPRFSYLDSSSETNGGANADVEYMPSSDFLKKQFAGYPELFSMQIELTSFCNLKCIHCYLGDEHTSGGMSTDSVLHLLDELSDMGTLKIAFSGGEVLSRPDLDRILCHARKNDFCISLLSNNTLLSDRMADSIKANNVAFMQISVYSMNPDTHDFITRRPGSLKLLIRNIDKLVARNVPIQVACPVMKQNLDSFTSVIEWGTAQGFRVKPDILLMARSDFTTNNLRHRLDMKESRLAIERILSSDVGYQESLRFKDIVSKPINQDDAVCGIGTSMMCISAEGYFYPCPGLNMMLGSYDSSSVLDVWRNSPEIKKLRGIRKYSYPKCLSCRSIDYCNMCPAKFYNESGGDIYALSEHFCGVAEINREIAERYKSQIHKGSSG
ncbi:MAG: radical SAM protein [Bacteroidales bacterium]|nr:radical SAM protein [Bacteroidales bacterium]